MALVDLRIPLWAALLSMMAGCSGTASTAASQHQVAARGGEEKAARLGRGEPGERGMPCQKLTQPGAPPVRVVWVTRAEPLITLTSPIGLLWGFQYAVRLPPGQRASYTLEHERCETPAHEEKVCMTFALPLPAEECAVRFAPRFGLDPSQYVEGKNLYSFALRLRRDGVVVSEDVFTFVLEYAPE